MHAHTVSDFMQTAHINICGRCRAHSTHSYASSQAEEKPTAAAHQSMQQATPPLLNPAKSGAPASCDGTEGPKEGSTPAAASACRPEDKPAKRRGRHWLTPGPHKRPRSAMGARAPPAAVTPARYEVAQSQPKLLILLQRFAIAKRNVRPLGVLLVLPVSALDESLVCVYLHVLSSRPIGNAYQALASPNQCAAHETAALTGSLLKLVALLQFTAGLPHVWQ